MKREPRMVLTDYETDNLRILQHELNGAYKSVIAAFSNLSLFTIEHQPPTSNHFQFCIVLSRHLLGVCDSQHLLFKC